MIGEQRTGLLPGVSITAVAHEGLTVMVSGKPARLAILADDGTVLVMGAEVAGEVETVAVNCYRATLQGDGHLRVISNPLESKAQA